MKNNISFIKSVEVYWKKHTQDAIQHTLTGFGISTLLIEGIHLFDFAEQKKYIAIILIALIGIVPVLVDFLFFYIRSQQTARIKLNKLDDMVNNIYSTNNSLMKSSALSRIDKEVEILEKMHKNRLQLPALQNFEYIREILGRVLHNVMEHGDKYITLSRLDFWTTMPNENKNFIRINNHAVDNEGKYIDRIIVFKKEMLQTQPDKAKYTNEQNELLGLINDFTKNGIKSNNYYAKFKTLFYFTNDYINLEEYLLSAIVVKKNFKDLMFIQVTNLIDIEKTNPKIDVKYYSLENWKIDTTAITDTVSILNSLFEYTSLKVSNDGNNAELSELQRYLRVYKECYGKLSSIYDISTGIRLSTINLNKCQLFDLKMIAEFFELPS